MKCPIKGCLNETLPGQAHCRQHLARPEIPVTIPKPMLPDVEIVRLESVPTFRIRNKRGYDLANALKVLQDGHALKIKVLNDKERRVLSHSVITYAKKFGIAAKYRTEPGFVYFWKPEQPKPAAVRKAAS